MKSHKDTSNIPKGFYCYSEDGVCPYWSVEVLYDTDDWMQVRPIKVGKCSYLNLSDSYEDNSGLLWDQVKECGINEDDEDGLLYKNF